MKLVLIITFFFSIAFNATAGIIASQRALTLQDGMNFSWLEQYWLGNSAINYSDYLDASQLPYLKQQLLLMDSMGFETLRLPVTFDKWEDRHSPYTFDSVSYFKNIDSVITWCGLLNMNLIIVYQHGVLYDSNFNSEKKRIVALWKQIANRYVNTNPQKVFFELYNEPNNITTSHWRTAAIAIIDALRPILPNHTFIVGATEWNSLYKLNEMGVLPDTNIIYNFHFYEPYIFTHQGASWGGPELSTTGIPFPYDSATMPPMNPLVIGTQGEGAYNYYHVAGTCQSISDALSIAANFGLVNNVPVWCGEFGSYSAFIPNDGSRCRYTECVKTNLDSLQIPYALWEWDEGFSIFNGPPSLANLPECMKCVFNIPYAPCTVTLQMRAFIEGFYMGGDRMRAVINPILSPDVCDSISVELLNSTTPFSIFYSASGSLDTMGYIDLTLPSQVYNKTLYIAVKHRNSLATWSNEPVYIDTSVIYYDFTTAATKAYGNNLAELPDGNFAIFSGDVDQDGNINLSDRSDIENSIMLFNTGYVNEDLTGDWMIESSDFSLFENNLGRISLHP